jgi:two-component system LytT family sensor kinase
MIACLLVILLGMSSNAHAGTDPDRETMNQLRQIELRIDSEPEQTIKELDVIVKRAIQLDLTESLPYAYVLLGKAYKVLEQPELAKHFIDQAEQIYAQRAAARQLNSLSDMNMPSAASRGAGDRASKEESVEEKNISQKKSTKLRLSKSKAAPTTEPEYPQVYLKNSAEINEISGNYSKAIDNYEDYKTKADASEQLDIDYAIAQNYYQLKEYDKAIEIYERLLKIETEAGNEVGRQKCLSNLAACYVSKGETDKGLEYFDSSLDEPEETEQEVFKDAVAEGSKKVSEALREQGKYEEERQVRGRSLEVLDDGVENLKLAQSYASEGKMRDAERSLDRFFREVSYRELIDASDVAVIAEVAKNLEDRGQFRKAYNYLKELQVIEDSIQKKQEGLRQKSQKLGTVGRESMLELEVLKKDKELSQNTINYLMREADLKEEVVSTQQYLIYLLCLIILLGGGSLVYILRVSRQRRIANQQLALRSLRSQMNPHFIFNALNSVNSFISTSDERSANKFLSEFSRLMRTVMENSEYELISLGKELEILKIYMELEHFRFQDKFDYELQVDPNLDEEQFSIPPMLLQPYIENAIWHGLRYKEEKGKLMVEISGEDAKLMVTITDDGIGRKRSAELKTKNQMKSKSTALKNINERIRIFNDLHKMKIEVDVQDLNDDGSGTVVKLEIPQSNG